jgi:hypothetical protein
LVVDGHDAISGAVHLQPPDGSPAREAPLLHAGNDRWTTHLRKVKSEATFEYYL